MKVLGKTWFTPMGSTTPIGIVVVGMNPQEQEEYDATTYSAWIGLAQGNKEGTEWTEQADIEHIVKTGARFPLDAAKLMTGVRG